MDNLKLRKIIVFLILIWTQNIRAQYSTVGIPEIETFSRQQYGGEPQNWDVMQAPNGLMYFANTYGLIEYDGKNWRVIKDINNNKVHRSLLVDRERIYIGAFNEFGFYSPNINGVLEYHSLVDQVNENDKEFDAIWRIYKTDEGVFFQSFKDVFLYDGKTVKTVAKPISRFGFSFLVDGELWVHDRQNGLFKIANNELVPVFNDRKFENIEVSDIVTLGKGKYLIATSFNGVFLSENGEVKKWDVDDFKLLNKKQIYTVGKLKDDRLIFGTIGDGLLIYNLEGKLLLKLNKENGLHNNSVLCFNEDREGNLWLGLDNGIARISPYSSLNYLQGSYNIGTGYCMVKMNDYVYFGTNQGVYEINEKQLHNPLKTSADFKLVEGTSGQVWSLFAIENKLFVGHDQGIYLVERNKTRKLTDKVKGGWGFVKPMNRDVIYVGTYEGIAVLKKNRQTGEWAFEGKLNGFKESSMSVNLDDENDLWVRHEYNGIYRIKFSKNDPVSVAKIDHYNEDKGITNMQGNRIFLIDGNVWVYNKDGMFLYKRQEDRFVKQEWLDEFLNENEYFTYLKRDSDNNIWFYSNHRVGVFRYMEDGTYKLVSNPFLKLKGKSIRGYENVWNLNSDEAVFGIEDGFAVYHTGLNSNFLLPLDILIRGFGSLNKGDLYKLGYYNIGHQKVIPTYTFNENSFWFSFSAPFYSNYQTEYSYKLEGGGAYKWSDWNTMGYKEFSNLKEGEYTFWVKSKNAFGIEAGPIGMKFIVLPPWYRSMQAYFIYIFFGISLLVGVIYFFLKSIEKSKLREQIKQKELFKEREEQMKKDSLIAEKEMIKLRNEKLRAEMVYKEKELTNSTYHIIQKNEFLTKLKNDLTRLEELSNNETVKRKILSIVRKINKDIDNKQQWELFETHLGQVHEEFLKRLKESYPAITPRELKVCVYLRMNMSSKEIASLMNITPRGVEISRYRIRKKIDLERSQNLTDYLMQF